jgi:iron complex transport system permease protein
MPGRPRALLALALLGLAGLGAFGWALWAGEVSIAPARILAVLVGGVDGMDAAIVRDLRLPRAAAVFAAGALLAMAGALMQVLLRNPLADPYILGIAGGAAVGALAAMMFGAAVWVVDAAAFSGALAAVMLVFGLAHGDGSWTQTRLLLTGVVVAAGCGAAITLMLALVPDVRVHSMLFWLMGDASGASRPWAGFVVLATALLLVMPRARELNVLARGELVARTLGVEVGRLRYLLYVVASLMTATAVTLVGAVGFVGLIVPHLMRLVVGNDQRILVPAALLAGGCLLLVADTAARTVVAPTQLPVGALTALFGVPMFLFLLSRHSSQR